MHKHIWGPVETARMTGNPHRKCTVEDCREVTLDLSDDEDTIEDELRIATNDPQDVAKIFDLARQINMKWGDHITFELHPDGSGHFTHEGDYHHIMDVGHGAALLERFNDTGKW
jgi:hypothetical protein